MKRKNQRPVANRRAHVAVRKTKSSSAARGKRANSPRPKSSGTKTAATASSRVKSSRDKVRAHRARMRANGLRLVQMWVPDAPAPESDAPANPKRTRAKARAASAISKTWAAVLDETPLQRPPRFEDIADLIGSIEGLPTDLASNKDRYLRACYGRKPYR